MGAMATQITSLTIVYSTVYSAANQRKHQSSAFVQWPVNSPHKWPVTQKMFHLMTSSWESPVYGQSRPILRAAALRIGRAYPWPRLSPYETDIYYFTQPDAFSANRISVCDDSIVLTFFLSPLMGQCATLDFIPSYKISLNLRCE